MFLVFIDETSKSHILQINILGIGVLSEEKLPDFISYLVISLRLITIIDNSTCRRESRSILFKDRDNDVLLGNILTTKHIRPKRMNFTHQV